MLKVLLDLHIGLTEILWSVTSKMPTTKDLVLVILMRGICSVLAFQHDPVSTISTDCVNGPSTWYNGKRNHTKSGYTCQRWDTDTPHMPNHLPTDGGNHNYCRNPDNDLRGVWCYTMNEHRRWEYCNVPKCDDDSQVIWTNYDAKKKNSRILSIHADPEVVKAQTDISHVFNVSVLLASNESLTEFWALAADYSGQRLFYSDYRSEYIGIRYLKKNITIKKFEKMAHGVESMAFDWVTKNLYWTDSEYKWVMVTDPTFSYYTPVYRADEYYTIHGIAIHAPLRKMFFSIYQLLQSKIISTDLAGKNPKTIIQFPDIFDVTGITIDYTDDRLYFTDFTGYGALLFSTTLDGKNKTQHHYKAGSIFWSVAAYMGYMYVTDINEKRTEESEKFYSVWVVPKHTLRPFRYTLTGRPRAVAVLSKNEERSFESAPTKGECGDGNGLPHCDHICLPQLNSNRKCACSLGYQLVNSTRCTYSYLEDEFLLVADSGQGRVFQVPFNYNNVTTPFYSIAFIPEKKNSKVTTVAVDIGSKALYWSDKTFNTIKKKGAVRSQVQRTTISSSNYATYMTVDPCTKNIFFLDSNTQSIKLMSPDGRFEKTILDTDYRVVGNRSIEMIVQDIRYKKIYWTDSKRTVGLGEVWRMNYDGTKQELVYENLHWPRGITIDYEDREGSGPSVFISEARTAMIYEVPLKHLETITNTSTQSIPKQHDLAAHINRNTYHITDIKVHKGMLYYMDGKYTGLEKFNLTEGPASKTRFGPAEFFLISSLAVFSNAEPHVPAECQCSSTACEHICVDMDGVTTSSAQCVCNDGFVASGIEKLNCTGKIPTNNPPSYGETCPNDITYNLGECENDVFPDWQEPRWNHDPSSGLNLKIISPPVPSRLVEGSYHFSYTATNSYGLTTICSFSVEVRAKQCPPPPSLPNHLVQTTLTCGLQFGSSYRIHCKDPSLTVQLGSQGKRKSYLSVSCDVTETWFPYINTSDISCSEDCVDGPSVYYSGRRNYTKSNITCQRWDVNSPHTPNHTPNDGGKHNYCRNPDNDLKGVWCYTTDPSTRWEYCDVPKCADDSMVVWTNYDTKTKTSRLLSIHADPEVVKQRTNDIGAFKVGVEVASNDSHTEYWALTASYEEKKLIYSDYKAEYVGIRDITRNETTRMFEGMAHGIESMAYDWMTKNLYWTDSAFKWIMAVESSFSYYTPIYRTYGEETIHAIAVHAKLRRLYFSSYKVLKSKIAFTDLAGGNLRVIVQFPNIYDVTGLTVDYTDDRLYFTDFTGYAAMLFSCKLDGSNRTQHFQRGGSVFWGVVAYMDYIYITDIDEKENEMTNSFYSLWVVRKSTPRKYFRYTVTGLPRAITVLSKNEERSFDKGSGIEECGEDNGLRKCDHICLPQLNRSRKCACSLGYQLVGETKCVSNNYDDDFLLVADSGQGRIFQVPFNYNGNGTSMYSIIASSGRTGKVTSVAADPISRSIYWSDKQVSSIERTLLGSGGPVKSLSTSNYASYMAVDPCSRSIFFLDTNTQSIKLMSPDGRYVKTLLQADIATDHRTSMEMIAQDVIYKKIYWTDTKGQIGKGEVWRMNYDGSDKELVYGNLNWPRGITVDYKNRDGSGASLLLSEGKTAMIYEIPLKLLKTITNTSTQTIPKQHDLAAHINRRRYHILDIKVHNGILYLKDGKYTSLEKFNLTKGPASLSNFGPAEFFSVKSISVFSRKDGTTSVDCMHSKCRSAKCDHMCVDVGGLSTSIPLCICNDGFSVSGHEKRNCTETSISSNPPPSFGSTCPDDIVYDVSECSDHVIPSWEEPVWTDNSKSKEKLVITRPTIPDKLFEGSYSYRYIATDHYGMTSACSFSVQVKATQCQPPPSQPNTMVQTNHSCGNRFGSTYSIQCKDKSLGIRLGNDKRVTWNKNFLNFCNKEGNWFPYNDYMEIKCTEEQASVSSIGSGILAAIVVITVILVLAIAAVVVMRIRHVGTSWLERVNFPKVWQRREDTLHFSNNVTYSNDTYDLM